MISSRRATSFFLLGWALAAGCGEAPSPQPAAEQSAPVPVAPPSIDQARSLLEASPEFSDYQFTRAAYSLPMKRSAMNEPARTAAASLRKAGWIALSGDEVVLSEKAKNDRRFIVRPNEVVDLVPLAKKELTGVTAVRASAAAAEPLVDFEWRWVPNEIGSLFPNRYEGTQKATATLLRDGEAWVVLRIEERQ